MLGFTIALELPMSSQTRKADISILNTEGVVAITDRADLGDGRERTRLANKLAKQLEKGTREQWEKALQQAHLKAIEERKAAEDQARQNPPPPSSPCSLPSGFEFEGEVFKSLSAVAKAITGQHCNGYHFFRLGKDGDR